MSLGTPVTGSPTDSPAPAAAQVAEPQAAGTNDNPAAAAARGRPPARRWWRRPAVLGPALIAGMLALIVVLTVLATDSSKGDSLDPRSADPKGTLALAELLRDRGIASARGGVPQAGGTLVVPYADRLEAAELTRVLDSARSAARVILLTPADVPDAGVVEGRLQGTSVRPPDCASPAAQTAGTADIGGRTYDGGSASCYAGSLLLTQRGNLPLVVLGSTSFLTNDKLDSDGNAALALGLTSGTGLPGQPSTSVTWYQPSLDPAADPPGLIDLIPDWVWWATLQLALAVALLALWRGRRFGPVVEEPLPVVVPAAETVEGRARLYAAGRARGAAADALRAGARARLGGALEHGGEPDPQGLVVAVAARAGRQPGEIAALLYGSAQPTGTPSAAPGPARGLGEPGAGTPQDDAALVRLADEIDRLEREVRAR